MKEHTLEVLFRRACAWADGVLNIAFQGGEPTLAGKDFFRKVLALEKMYRRPNLIINKSIQTNGYALDEEWAQIFRDGNFLVGVSVDGIQETHDAYRLDAAGNPTFARIEKNLEMLRKFGVEYNVLCVVNRDVAASAEQVVKGLAKHQYMQFIPCLDGFE